MPKVIDPPARVHPAQALLDDGDEWLTCHWCWLSATARFLSRIEEYRDAHGPRFAPSERHWLGFLRRQAATLSSDYHATDRRLRSCPLHRKQARRGE